MLYFIKDTKIPCQNNSNYLLKSLQTGYNSCRLIF
jgi:hypothetical protein